MPTLFSASSVVCLGAGGMATLPLTPLLPSSSTYLLFAPHPTHILNNGLDGGRNQASIAPHPDATSLLFNIYTHLPAHQQLNM